MAVVLRVPPLPLATAVTGAPLFEQRPSMASADPYLKSTGFLWWHHNVPADAVVAPDSGVQFPDKKDGSANGPVIWLTKPGTYSANIVMAWTLPPPDGSSTPPTPNPADDVAHVLKLCLSSFIGSNPPGGSSTTWSPNMSPLVATTATKSSLTPVPMPPDRYVPNYVTQSMQVAVTVPAGSFGALRIESAASKDFGPAIKSVVYTLDITRVGGDAAVQASSKAARSLAALAAVGTGSTGNDSFPVNALSITWGVIAIVALVLSIAALALAGRQGSALTKLRAAINYAAIASS